VVEGRVKLEDHSPGWTKITTAKRAGAVVEAVEHLPSKYKALSSKS
jgi:hypothetical protein